VTANAQERTGSFGLGLLVVFFIELEILFFCGQLVRIVREGLHGGFLSNSGNIFACYGFALAAVVMAEPAHRRLGVRPLAVATVVVAAVIKIAGIDNFIP
jgi:hypothetical protein